MTIWRRFAPAVDVNVPIRVSAASPHNAGASSRALARASEKCRGQGTSRTHRGPSHSRDRVEVFRHRAEEWQSTPGARIAPTALLERGEFRRDHTGATQEIDSRALFKSKTVILAELLDRSSFGPHFRAKFQSTTAVPGICGDDHRGDCPTGGGLGTELERDLPSRLTSSL